LEKLLIASLSLFFSLGIIKFFFGDKKQEKKESPTQEETLELNISGMHCAGCSAGIEGTLNAVEGITQAKVNFATGKGVFKYDPEKISPQVIIAKIQELGYSVSADLDELEKKS